MACDKVARYYGIFASVELQLSERPLKKRVAEIIVFPLFPTFSKLIIYYEFYQNKTKIIFHVEDSKKIGSLQVLSTFYLGGIHTTVAAESSLLTHLSRRLK